MPSRCRISSSHIATINTRRRKKFFYSAGKRISFKEETVFIQEIPWQGCWRMEGNTLKTWSGRGTKTKRRLKWPMLENPQRLNRAGQNRVWPAAGTSDVEILLIFFNSLNFYISSQTFLAHSTLSLLKFFLLPPTPTKETENVIIVLLNPNSLIYPNIVVSPVPCWFPQGTCFFNLINLSIRFTRIRYHWKECSTIYCWNRELLWAGSLCRAQQILNIALFLLKM